MAAIDILKQLEDSADLLDRVSRSVFQSNVLLFAEQPYKNVSDTFSEQVKARTATFKECKNSLPQLKGLLTRLDWTRSLLFTNPMEWNRLSHIKSFRNDLITPENPTFATGKRLYDILGLKMPETSIHKSLIATETLPTQSKYKLFSVEDKEYPNSEEKEKDKDNALLEGLYVNIFNFPEYVWQNYFFFGRKYNEIIASTADATPQKKTINQALRTSPFANIDAHHVQDYAIQRIIASLYAPSLLSRGAANSIYSYFNPASGASKRGLEQPEEEKPAAKKLKRLDEDEQEETPMTIGSSTNIANVAKPTKPMLASIAQFKRAERIYHFLTSLYAFVSDMVNIIEMANSITDRKTRAEEMMETLSDVKLYYYTHVYGALMPYFTVTLDDEVVPPKSKTFNFRTIWISQKMANITRDSIIDMLPESDKNDVKNYTPIDAMNHLWCNLTTGKKQLPALYLPWIFCSAFQTVEVDEKTTTLRGSTAYFRKQMVETFAQFRNKLALQNIPEGAWENPLAKPKTFGEAVTLLKKEYMNTITLTWTNAIPWLSRKVQFSEASLQAAISHEYIYSYTIKTEGEKEGGKLVKRTQTFDVFDWVFTLFGQQQSNYATSNAKFMTWKRTKEGDADVLPDLNLVLHGNAIILPTALFEFLGLANHGFNTLILSSVKNVIWFPNEKQTSANKLQTLFKSDGKIKLIRSTLYALPQAIIHDVNDTTLQNVKDLDIVGPLRSEMPWKPVLIHMTKSSSLRLSFQTLITKDEMIPKSLQPINLATEEADKFNVIVSGRAEFERLGMAKTNTKEWREASRLLSPTDAQAHFITIEQHLKQLVRPTTQLIQIQYDIIPPSLSDHLPFKRPDAKPGAIFGDIARWWWDAHLFNETYSDDNVFYIEELRPGGKGGEEEKERTGLPYLEFLGPRLENTVFDTNYLANAPDLKQDIMQGKTLEGIDITPESITVKSGINNHSEEDVKLLNQYKLLRIGQSVMNWLTDNTSMLCVDMADVDLPKKIITQDGLPSSVITDGVFLLAHSYTTKDPNQMTRIEYMKGTDMENNEQLVFVPRVKRNKSLDTESSLKQESWVNKLLDRTTSSSWTNLDSNEEFATLFRGFDGIGVMFSNYVFKIRKTYDRIQSDRTKVEKILKILQEAVANAGEGDTKIEINKSLYEGLKDLAKKSAAKEAEFAAKEEEEAIAGGEENIEEEEEVVEIDLEEAKHTMDIFYVSTTSNATANDIDNMQMDQAVHMLFDAFDRKRLDVAKTTIYHDINAVTGEHTLSMSNTIVTDGMKLDRIPLLSFGRDNSTGYWVSIPLRTVFLLMAFRCVYAPVSPFHVFQEYLEYKKSKVLNETKEDYARFLPYNQAASLGNIHTTSVLVDKLTKPLPPLGNVPNAYVSMVNDLLYEQENIFDKYPAEATDYVFNHLNKRIKSAMDMDKLSELGETPQSDLADKAEEFNYTQPIWSVVSNRDTTNHMNLLVGHDIYNMLWQPRCYNDFFTQPLSWLSVSNLPHRNQTGDITFHKLDLPDMVNLYYNKLFYKGSDYIDIWDPQGKQLSYTGRDYPLLADTWRFPWSPEQDEDEEEAMDIEEETKGISPQTNLVNGIKMEVRDETTLEGILNDRSRVGEMFQHPPEAYAYRSMTNFNHTLYDNFAFMAMVVLETECKQKDDNLLGSYCNWFTRRLMANHIAYQIPQDTIQHTRYRFNITLDAALDQIDMILKHKEDEKEDEAQIMAPPPDRKNTNMDEDDLSIVLYRDLQLLSQLRFLMARWIPPSHVNPLDVVQKQRSEAKQEMAEEKQDVTEELELELTQYYHKSDYPLMLFDWPHRIYDSQIQLLEPLKVKIATITQAWKKMKKNSQDEMKMRSALKIHQSELEGLEIYLASNKEEYENDKRYGITTLVTDTLNMLDVLANKKDTDFDLGVITLQRNKNTQDPEEKKYLGTISNELLTEGEFITYMDLGRLFGKISRRMNADPKLQETLNFFLLDEHALLDYPDLGKRADQIATLTELVGHIIRCEIKDVCSVRMEELWIPKITETTRPVPKTPVVTLEPSEPEEEPEIIIPSLEDKDAMDIDMDPAMKELHHIKDPMERVERALNQTFLAPELKSNLPQIVARIHQSINTSKGTLIEPSHIKDLKLSVLDGFYPGAKFMPTFKMLVIQILQKVPLSETVDPKDPLVTTYKNMKKILDEFMNIPPPSDVFLTEMFKQFQKEIVNDDLPYSIGKVIGNMKDPSVIAESAARVNQFWLDVAKMIQTMNSKQDLLDWIHQGLLREGGPLHLTLWLQLLFYIFMSSMNGKEMIKLLGISPADYSKHYVNVSKLIGAVAQLVKLMYTVLMPRATVQKEEEEEFIVPEL